MTLQGMVNPERAAVAMAKLTFDGLDKSELTACYLATQIGGGIKDYTLGYEKIAHLVDADGKLHDLVQKGLQLSVDERL